MLEIDGVHYAPDLIIFDKDGTLIEFGAMWHTWFEAFLGHIRQRGLSLQGRAGLAGTLGYDMVSGVWDPQGPLTLASTGEIVLLAASQIYRYLGLTWNEALACAQAAEEAARGTLADDSLLAPVGDVRGKLEELVQAGHLLGLATTDTRASTERHLQALGGAGLFSAIVCGDDGVPLKPAPDMALAICRQLGVEPSRTILIGDTVLDMDMARAAGLAAAIGVTSGAMPGEVLRGHADGLVTDIHAIHVLKG